MRPRARRHHGERQKDQGAGAADQTGIHLRLRSHQRSAGVAHRGEAGRADEGARREDERDAADPHQTAAVRAPGLPAGVPDRLHARAEGGSAEGGVAIQDGAGVHAADHQGSGRQDRPVVHSQRRELARWIPRS